MSTENTIVLSLPVGLTKEQVINAFCEAYDYENKKFDKIPTYQTTDLSEILEADYIIEELVAPEEVIVEEVVATGVDPLVTVDPNEVLVTTYVYHKYVDFSPRAFAMHIIGVINMKFYTDALDIIKSRKIAEVTNNAMQEFAAEKEQVLSTVVYNTGSVT